MDLSFYKLTQAHPGRPLTSETHPDRPLTPGFPLVPQHPPARQGVSVVSEVGVVLGAHIYGKYVLSSHRFHHISWNNIQSSLPLVILWKTTLRLPCN